MSHKEIVARLKQCQQVNGWWQQMITVAHEQSRGLLEKHQEPGGFQIGRSKTYAVNIDLLYGNWLDDTKRVEWLSDPDVTIRKANTQKNIWMKRIDDQTVVETQFYPKGSQKTLSVVQHSKLSDAGTAEKMKEY